MLRYTWLLLFGWFGCSSMHDKMASSQSSSDQEWANYDKKGDEGRDDDEDPDGEEASGSSDKFDAMEDRNKDAWSTKSNSDKLPPGPNCLNQRGDVQECLEDKDCCPQFYCGIDPEGNARVKVCLFGG